MHPQTDHQTRLVISNYDSPKNPYYAGGGAFAVLKIATGLQKMGFRVLVMAGKYPGCLNERIDGVEYRYVGSGNFGPKLGQLAYQLSLISLIFRLPFDIWLESFTPPFSTTCLPLFTNKPVIGSVHMLAGEDMQRKYHLPFKLAENLGLKTYSYIHVTSDQIRQLVHSKTPGSKIQVIPNGIDIPVLPKKPVSGNYILFIGRIEINQKGLDLLLRAYSLLLPGYSGRLVIAGSGTAAEVSALKLMIGRLGLSDRVILPGRVTGREKFALFVSADLVVVPSRFETFSFAALEVLAYQKPLVTFDIDGLKWVPADCCLKTACFDVHALSRHIQNILNNPRQSKVLAQKGRKFAKNFSWNQIINSYAVYLSSVQKNYGTSA